MCLSIFIIRILPRKGRVHPETDALVLLGPLGSFTGGGLSSLLVMIQSHVSIAAYIIMAAAMPFIVMTGLIAGIMHIEATSFASPSVPAIPIFVNADRPSNFMLACACAVISVVLAFALTWVLGFNEAERDACMTCIPWYRLRAVRSRPARRRPGRV